MALSTESNQSNNTCFPLLLWNQTSIDKQRPLLYVCCIATVTHTIFWFQLIFCPTVRQKSMQWIYAYLVTDILLLARFFFTFIVHTTSYECTTSAAWYYFVCYIEAAADNYLNVLEVYILLALNLCRYAQIAWNKNVFVTHIKLLILAHVLIYSASLISLAIQIVTGWAQLDFYVGASCDIGFTSISSQLFNTITAFVLPILLNIMVIGASIRHVHVTSNLQRAQHHVSAREKYHRSLVIQFVVFYIIWLSLWSPNIIVYQFTSGSTPVTRIALLLNYIEITLDPLIISALDVRFYHAWKKFWADAKNRSLQKFHTEQRRVLPMTIANTLQTTQQPRTRRF